MLDSFSLIDMAVFGLSLCLSASVGIYYAVKNRRLSLENSQTGSANINAKEQFTGGGKMPLAPTVFSLLASFLSGILLLAVPAEIYEHGALMWVYMMAGVAAMLLNLLLFLPPLYRYGPGASVYRYFEWRFGSPFLRRATALLFVANTFVYVAIVTYAPAVVFAEIIDIPFWVFILIVGLLSTFYTVAGGIKAVVWTDTLQAFMMYLGVLAVVIKGTVEVGGVNRVFAVAAERGRQEPLLNLNPSPLQYFSLWIAFFGGLGFWLAQYGLNQIAIQRYCNLSSLNAARTAIGLTAVVYALLVSLCCYIGLVMLAYFDGCDPIEQGLIQKRDQYVIHFVRRLFASWPGLTGVFLAALCSGTLSTISSGINSITAVLHQDFLPMNVWGQRRYGGLIPQALTAVVGLAATLLAFSCDALGGLLKAATSLMGALTGPTVGLFVLAICVRRANSGGAIIAFLTTAVCLLWFSAGNLIYQPYRSYRLNVTTNASLNDCGGVGILGESGFEDNIYGDTNVFFAYRIANWLYPIIGAISVVLIGTVASLILAPKQNPNEIAAHGSPSKIGCVAREESRF